MGFRASSSRVSAYVRDWREAGTASSESVFIPLKFALGAAYQIDWSEEALLIGGRHDKLPVAHTRLYAGRAFLLIAYPTQSHEMSFDAHAWAFRVFGGIPKRGIYVNMKTAVDKVRVGKRRNSIRRFAAMAAHYLFEPEFCNVAAGWEKGVVGNNVQDSRRRIWQDAGNRRVGSFAERNVWLEARCQALRQGLPYPEVAHLTIADALTIERSKSLPCAFANHKLSVHPYPDRIEVQDDDGIVATHERSVGRREVRYDRRHFLPLVARKPGALRNSAPFEGLPEALQQLTLALLKRPAAVDSPIVRQPPTGCYARCSKRK